MTDSRVYDRKPNGGAQGAGVVFGLNSSGEKVALQVDDDGKLSIEITGEGLALDVSVDGLETLITSSNTKLDTLHTDLGTTIHADLATTLAGLLERSASTARLLSAANSTNATVVKASAGRVTSITGWNAAAVSYLKLYDKATTPDEADTPRHTEYLAASQKFQLTWTKALNFANGISYRIVTDGADNSTASVATAAVLAMNIDYI